MARVVVTGAAGQVGVELVAAFSGWDVIGLDRAALDVTDRSAVRAALRDLRPDAVVNAAAWTDVDGCELDPGRAMRENAEPVRWLADAADEVGAHLCHISTDFVFDGVFEGTPEPYDESAVPNPISAYGRSKLAGEGHLSAASTLVRTSWVFGVHGRNIVKTVLRLAADPAAELTFVDDQVGSPTEAGELARTIHELVELRAAGIFHVANDSAMSWYEVACETLAAAGADPARVRPVATADLLPVRPARRPAYSVLVGVATAAAGVTLPGSTVAAIRRVVNRLPDPLRSGS